MKKKRVVKKKSTTKEKKSVIRKMTKRENIWENTRIKERKLYEITWWFEKRAVNKKERVKEKIMW